MASVWFYCHLPHVLRRMDIALATSARHRWLGRDEGVSQNRLAACWWSECAEWFDACILLSCWNCHQISSNTFEYRIFWVRGRILYCSWDHLGHRGHWGRNRQHAGEKWKLQCNRSSRGGEFCLYQVCRTILGYTLLLCSFHAPS